MRHKKKEENKTEIKAKSTIYQAECNVQLHNLFVDTTKHKSCECETNHSKLQQQLILCRFSGKKYLKMWSQALGHSFTDSIG